MPATFDDVLAIVQALPGVTEGVSYGHRAFRVGDKTFAWERPFTKADLKRFGDEIPPDGPILGVRVADLDEKAALLALAPKGVFTIPHFEGYAAVLIQLRVVDKRVLRTAILEAYRAFAPTEKAAARTRRRST